MSQMYMFYLVNYEYFNIFWNFNKIATDNLTIVSNIQTIFDR